MNINSFRFFLSEGLSGFIISGAVLQVFLYRNRPKHAETTRKQQRRGRRTVVLKKGWRPEWEAVNTNELHVCELQKEEGVTLHIWN